MDEQPQGDSTDIPPPQMSPGNSVLRFVLEVTALISIGHWAYHLPVVTWAKVMAAIAAPFVAASAWGVFNVPNDPSRSGHAPIQVPGLARLGLELSILAWGAYGLYLWNLYACGIYMVGCVGHYVLYHKRIVWLFKH